MQKARGQLQETNGAAPLMPLMLPFFTPTVTLEAAPG